MKKHIKVQYLELISDILGLLVLYLLVLQVGSGLLRLELHAGQFVPGVGGQRLNQSKNSINVT